MESEPNPPGKKRLCKLLRGAAACFIEETTGDAPAEKRAASELRHEVDALLTLYEGGLIDPVAQLRAAPLDSEESAVLTGAR